MCKKKSNKKGEPLVFSQDHDHRCCPRRLKEFCGKCNRGLLCFRCNKFALGILEKLKLDPQSLADYVKKWDKILKDRGAYEPKETKAPRRKKARVRHK